MVHITNRQFSSQFYPLPFEQSTTGSALRTFPGLERALHDSDC